MNKYEIALRESMVIIYQAFYCGSIIIVISDIYICCKILEAVLISGLFQALRDTKNSKLQKYIILE